MTIVEITGNCCYCGKWLGPAAYRAQEAICVTSVHGAVVLCAAHVYTKDNAKAPEYDAAVRALAAAKAKQIREAEGQT